MAEAGDRRRQRHRHHGQAALLEIEWDFVNGQSRRRPVSLFRAQGTGDGRPFSPEHIQDDSVFPHPVAVPEHARG